MPDMEWTVADAVLALLISANTRPDERALAVAESTASRRNLASRPGDTFRADAALSIHAARLAAEMQQNDARELLQVAIIKTDAWRRARR